MGTIDFCDVSFAYGDEAVLRHLSYSFPATGLFIIIGPSGCGKTTFLSLCARTLSPTSGTISFAEGFSPALVLQSPLLLDYMDVEDNLLLSFLLRGRKRKDCLDKVDSLLSLVDLKAARSQDVRTLSGGEQMRLSIARALAAEGNALILDEPTGQLDEKSSQEIYFLLERLSQDRLVLLVTHDEKNALRLQGTILRLEKGRLCLERRGPETDGTPSPSKGDVRPLSLRESFRWTLLFLRRRRLRLLLSAFFLALNLSLLGLGINVAFHVDPAMDLWLDTFYDSAVVRVSRVEEIAQSDHLLLTRRQAADEDTCLQLGLMETCPSLSFFLPESQETQINGVRESFSLLPVLSQDPGKISLGEVAKGNSVVVNRLFLQAFRLEEEEALGTSFFLSHSAVVRPSAFREGDLVRLPLTLTIAGICSEEEAFLVPTAYYDQAFLEERLSGVYLENISEERGKPTSVIDLFSVTDDAGDDFRGGCVLAECADVPPVLSRAEKLYRGSVQVQSKKEATRENTEELVSSLLLVLLAFVAMTLLSSFLLSFLSVSSLYQENIRLLALMRTYPCARKNQFRLGGGMWLSFLLLTASLLLFLSTLIQASAGAAMRAMGMPAFVAALHMPSLLSALLLAALFSALAALLPLRKVRERDIKEQLEGED